MNYATTTKGRKGALRQLLMVLLSTFFVVALVCTSFPVSLAYAEDSSKDTAPITVTEITDEDAVDPAVDSTSGDEAVTESAESDEGSTVNENAVGVLEVLLSDGTGAYSDVTTLADGVTDWKVDQLRTLHVNFEFASGADKTLTINVPTGYQIVGYSAMDDTPTKDSLTNIEIDPQYKEFFQSSDIVGVDGVTAWTKQYTAESYTGHNTSTAYPLRTYGGVVTYAFSDAATEGQVVMTLKPQLALISHTSTTELLDPITVSMSSAAETGMETSVIERSFSANVTHVTVAGMGAGSVGVWIVSSAYVPYSIETGLSEQFGVISALSSYSGDTTYGSQGFYADYWTLTINYPKGVSFDNEIHCQYLGLGNHYETTDDVYRAPGEEVVADHFILSVSGDKTTGGQVVFAFENTYFTHSSANESLGAYFTADASLVESDELVFAVEMSMENKGYSRQCANNRTRTLVADDGNYMIELASRNIQRRDIHADYPDYPYDYAMGSFRLVSKLPYSDVTLFYDFTDLNGVRGIGSPGQSVRDIMATTTEGRELYVDSVPDAYNYGGYYGTPITAEQLGLNDGECIETLTCTVDLAQVTYRYLYTTGMAYYGHFIDGQEGDAVLSILDKNGEVAINDAGKKLTVVDHTTLSCANSGAGWLETKAMDESGQAATTFHPNEVIKFSSILNGGVTWSDSDTIIDPTIMISLPEGINLDTSSVVAASPSGNHNGAKFPLAQINTPLTMVIDGTRWTTYYFTSAEPLDMVALEPYPGHETTHIVVYFDAYVSSNSAEYGQISLQDCIQWDLGFTSVNSNSGRDLFGEDMHNRAGKNTEDAIYKVHESGDNFTVKPLIGLNVDLGIRVLGSGTDFFTYDTTEDSIAGLLKNERAEVQVVYENTASTDYFKGSAIYLPVPGVGNDYARFFQNIEVTDPLNVESNTTFEFDAFLETPVTMDGFTTYYAVDVTENVEAYDPSTNASTWAPVSADWMSYDELTAAGHDFADVVFLKLVADRDIHSGESGSTVFELSIGHDAKLDQVDYWRAYSKAVTDQSDNTGVWNYSSVIAATPVNFGVSGQFFLDFDEDGLFSVSAGDETYTGGNVTAVLSRDGGGMDNIPLTVASDGSFRSLNENGTDYYLKTGSYTVTFTNSDETFVYSPVPGAGSSSEAVWYNDLDPANLADATATYRFTVSADTTLGTYVGVALIPEFISVNVPVKVTIALDSDGSWYTPTALDNRIINLSTCAMRVSSAMATPMSGFSLLTADQVTSSAESNVLGGTIQPVGGKAQDLSKIICPASEWTMASGFATDGSNELPLQLTGSLQNAEGAYFADPIQAFDITYTFEKAKGGE